MLLTFFWLEAGAPGGKESVGWSTNEQWRQTSSITLSGRSLKRTVRLRSQVFELMRYGTMKKVLLLYSLKVWPAG